MKFFLIFFSLIVWGESDFIGGLGYLEPEVYRKDNEINPLPLGMNFIPILGYKSEYLKIFGPRVTLNLYQGPIGFSLNLNTTGDRYKAHNLNKREVAIDSGVSLRILFLTIKYTSDISKVYEGNQYQISIGKPFTIGDSIRFIPRIVKEYQNTSFTNYYYGVIEEEIGVFKKYSLDNAANDIIGLTTILKLSEAMNFSINYSRKTFDEVIYKSPTIQLRRYNMTSIFWSFLF